MTSWNWMQPGMPYRCNYMPLASVCKSISPRNAGSFSGGNGSSDSTVVRCPPCHQQVRPPPPTHFSHQPGTRDAMNSTYYLHQLSQRNAWIRGTPSVSTGMQMTPPFTTPVIARPVLFRVNNVFQQMMVFGQFPWRSLHNSGIGDRSGDRNGSGGCGSAAMAAALTPSPWNRSGGSQVVQKCQTDIAANQLRRDMDNVRRWEYTEAGHARLRSHDQQRHHDDGMEFTVVSYNILAQCLLDDNLYLYKNCRSVDLAWENRRWRLVDEFRRLDADVLCLQEVQCNHYESFFVPELAKLGYKGLYKMRTGDKHDGCAIFFRERVFELDQLASIEYSRQEMPTLNRDNIALVAILRVRQHDKPAAREDNQKLLCVANTHLLFNPKRGDIRLAQLQILFAELDRLAFCGFKRSSSKQQQQKSQQLKAAYHPIIVCGDMNSRPQCHLYKFVVSGSLKYEGLMASDVSNPNVKRSSPKRGRVCLEKELVPSRVGITDRCQFRDTTESRRRITASIEGCSDDDAADDDTGDVADAFSSGKMTHGLHLVSVYGHRLDGDRPEVTTHHDRASTTVDYIFYSVKKKRSTLQDDRVVHERVTEGRLSLLATRSLPSSAELNSFGGLPNAVLPSDHVHLAAKFLLKTK